MSDSQRHPFNLHRCDNKEHTVKKIEIFHSFKGLIRSTVVNLALINGHLK